MDRQGFGDRLRAMKQSEAQVQAALAMAERFDTFLQETGHPPTAESALEFSQRLIAEGNNNEANYLAVARYCRFIKNNEMFVAFVELLDGGEVSANLYRMAAERFGTDIRDEIFAGIGVAPYGTHNSQKPAYLMPVIARLQERVGEPACAEFLSACLRDLPDQEFLPEREKYLQAGSLEAYLRQRRDAFLAELEACQREGRLFFTLEITPEVLEFARSEPEMGGGRLEGDVIYEVKIPYAAKQYLAETDPQMKRYYGCHCPWAREAIKNGDVELAEVFCNCSAGFTKKPLEAALGTPLKVDVLESILKGDLRCRFAVHVPQGV